MPTKQAPRLMRFRLVSGMYEDFDPKMPRPKAEQRPGEPRKDFEERAIRETEEWERKARRIFHFNDPSRNVIDSDIDLCAHYNSNDPNAAPKFERVFDREDGLHHQQPGETVEEFIARIQNAEAAKPKTPQNAVQAAAEAGFNTAFTDTYESMTIEQLRQHAADEEIDLGNAKTKKEIIAVLKSLQPQQA